MLCPHCNQEHPSDSLFCPVTGKRISLPEAVCSQCGQPVDPSWQHCSFCGHLLIQTGTGSAPQGLAETAPDLTPSKGFLETDKGSSGKPWWVAAVGVVLFLALAVLAVVLLKGIQINPIDPLAQAQTATSPKPTSAIQNDLKAIGPAGGNIIALIIDPYSATTLYAGTTDRGIFKTTNAGEDWTEVNNGFLDAFNVRPAVSSMAIDPANSTILYAGTNVGVFKSTDGGGLWMLAKTGLTNINVTALALDPSRPSNLYAGTESGGFFKTMDGGETWTPHNTGLTVLPDFSVPRLHEGTKLPPRYTTITHLLIDPLTSSTIYAAAKDCLYKSTNGGIGWQAVIAGLTDDSSGKFPYNGHIFSLMIDPNNPTSLYTSTSFGLFRSTDGGENWSAQITYHTWDNQGLPANALVLDPQTSEILFAGTAQRGVLKSSNGGKDWSIVDTSLARFSINAMVIDPADPYTIYIATGGGGIFTLMIGR